MKCEITIDSPLLTEKDETLLNQGEIEIRFFKTETHHFLPPEAILILVELGKTIGYSAAYDILKHALGKLITVLVQQKKEKPVQTKMEVVCGDTMYSLCCNFELTEEQKDKLVDAAARKLLESRVENDSVRNPEFSEKDKPSNE